MVFVCLLVPILLLGALLGLGRFEDHLLRGPAPGGRGRPPAALPPTGWSELSALEGAAGTAVVPTGTE
ncbi:MAG TPA: hypothetical protein VGX23_03645 [Actinocrinis sp.]|nr:hypothetical protein [Actinocrinis sp.]